MSSRLYKQGKVLITSQVYFFIKKNEQILSDVCYKYLTTTYLQF